MRIVRRARMAAYVAVALSLLAGSIAAAPTALASHEPPPVTFDYTKIEGLSEPVHETTKTTLELPSFDGTNLYLEVTRPNAEGRFPVILEASPYHGTIADRDGTRIFPGPRDAQNRQIGLTGYFAPRGYAVVMMDLRGTGRSEGCLDHLAGKDAKDLVRVINWAASQPWSNGRVGMTGHSYVGSTPVAAAAQNVPALKTIVPSAGLGAMYHHQWQHGVPYYLQWAGVQWTYEYLAMLRHMPPAPINEPVAGGTLGDNFGNDMEDFGCGWPNSSLVSGEDQLSGRYAQWHAERDWREGATKARIPVFLVHGVNDNAARIAAADWFFERQAYFEQAGIAQPPDKAWIGQWDHGSNCCPNRRGKQWTAALHAWFDKWLQQRPVKTGPRYEVFMSDGTFAQARTGDREEVVVVDKFPRPTKSSTLELFASSEGGLQQQAPGNGSVSFTGTPEGFVNQANARGVEFTTGPLPSDLYLAGLPELHLSASVSLPRVNLIANVFHRFRQGNATVTRRISQFAINPELRNGVETRENVTPGARYEMDPPGFAIAQHLRKGDELVLKVTTSDPDKAPFFATEPLVTVFSGATGTKLTVPVLIGPAAFRDTVPL